MGCGASRTDKTTPTLYIWPGSAPCRAVMMVARAAKIRLRLQNINLMKREQYSKRYKKINPNHTVPTLVDGKSKVLDSRAIIVHLVELYARGNKIYPLNEGKRSEIDGWLKYNQNIFRDAVTSYVYPVIFSEEEADVDAETVVRECLHKLEIELSGKSYLTGSDVTLADFVIEAEVSLLELIEFNFQPWPAVASWRNKLKALPYYAACNKGLEDWKFALHVKKCSDKQQSGNCPSFEVERIELPNSFTYYHV